MIVVRLRGGLGNQMFQYALGRCMAARRGDELVLECGKLRARPNATPRDYSLDIFRLNATFAAMSTIQAQAKVLTHIVQCRRGFHQEVFECRAPDIVLEGYWSSEQYFLEIESLICSDFTFRSSIERYNPIMPSHDSPNSRICIHVRRGDYLTSAGAGLGFLGLKYYEDAIALIVGQIKDPHFYIFSDDIPWCIDNLRIEHPHTYMRHNCGQKLSTAIDFQLMTSCQHFIIANSSFSWWAAWLATKKADGIVVAPCRWLCDRVEIPDLIPRRWMQI